MLEKFFKLSQNGTNVKTEIIAGISTFVTMAYIVALNPNLLTGFGAHGTDLWNAVFMATIISSFVGTMLMAFLANKPFALAPGMGLNTYFAAVVGTLAVAMGVEYREAFPAGLAIIFTSGVLFLILTALRVRQRIVSAIPNSIRLGIPAGIGLMLVNIGLGSNASIFTDSDAFQMLSTFFTLGPSATSAAMGESYTTMLLYVATLFVGIFSIAIFAHKKIVGSILFGVGSASVFYWVALIIMGQNPFQALESASFVPPFADMINLTLFKLDFKGLFSIGIFSAVMTIITFAMVDMFDTIGTLIGTAKKANMVNEAGDMENMSGAMLADSISTCTGALTGTSTITTFIESAAGVEEGGRTGLASVVTAILFLLCMFISPIVALIPAPATSAALVYVGVLMIGALKEVNYSDLADSMPIVLMLIFMVVSSSIGTGIGIGLITNTAILMIGALKEVNYSDLADSMPIVLMLIFMVVSSSIGTGIGIGLITNTAIKLLTGRAREISAITYILSLLFLGKFFIIF